MEPSSGHRNGDGGPGRHPVELPLGMVLQRKDPVHCFLQPAVAARCRSQNWFCAWRRGGVLACVAPGVGMSRMVLEALWTGAKATGGAGGPRGAWPLPATWMWKVSPPRKLLSPQPPPVGPCSGAVCQPGLSCVLLLSHVYTHHTVSLCSHPRA